MKKKYRTISLLNFGGKVLEIMLNDRISHLVFSKTLLNENQHGFFSQKGTVDTALAAKDLYGKPKRKKNCVVILSLDVKGAFDADLWPRTQSKLRKGRCPKYMFTLSLNYFSDRVAKHHANTHTHCVRSRMVCKLRSC